MNDSGVPLEDLNQIFNVDSSWRVTKSTFPFFCVLLVGVIVLILFPEIATYLPAKMTG